jgi:uncharacterized protein YutE (UPF0331/DUF86 family)
MGSTGELKIFLSDFDHQFDVIKRIYETLAARSEAWKGETVVSESVESTGYWLHNLYCAYEDLFKLVSGFWENSIGKNGHYYVNLLKRMAGEIEAVRPALISQKAFVSLDELRGFRHVFRHAYSYGLDDERVRFLLRRVLAQKEMIFTDISRFRKAVEGIIREQ